LFANSYYKNKDDPQHREWSLTGQFHGPAIVAQYFLHYVPPTWLCQGSNYYNPIAGDSERWLWPRNKILLDDSVKLEAIQGIHNMFPAIGAIWNTNDDQPEDVYDRVEEVVAIEAEIQRYKRELRQFNKDHPQRKRRKTKVVKIALEQEEGDEKGDEEGDEEGDEAVVERTSGNDAVEGMEIEETRGIVITGPTSRSAGAMTNAISLQGVQPEATGASFTSSKVAWDSFYNLGGDNDKVEPEEKQHDGDDILMEL
jgi:hypothetical protein